MTQKCSTNMWFSAEFPASENSFHHLKSKSLKNAPCECERRCQSLLRVYQHPPPRTVPSHVQHTHICVQSVARTPTRSLTRIQCCVTRLVVLCTHYQTPSGSEEAEVCVCVSLLQEQHINLYNALKMKAFSHHWLRRTRRGSEWAAFSPTGVPEHTHAHSSSTLTTPLWSKHSIIDRCVRNGHFMTTET